MPVGILLLVAAGMATVILLLAHVIGPRRTGPTKSGTYESGMPLVTEARGRFNVRFYLVAILFLLFDVEIVFLWLWAPLFRDVAGERGSPLVREIAALGFGKGVLAIEMGLFVVVLTAGLAYAWRKGVFRWN
jgi:NADH-quinone oxidoreductase subunit A